MRWVCKYLFLCLIPIYIWGKSYTENSVVKKYEEMLIPFIGMDDLSEVKSIADSLSKELEKKSDDPVKLLELAILYHNLSNYGFSKGYRGYAEKAFNILRGLYNDQIGEALIPFVLVYLGSSRALMGNESSNPTKKIAFVKEGLKYLDCAAKQYYDVTYVVPLIRGNVCISLPDFFNREKTAWKDFRYLEKKYSEDEGSIPGGVMCNVFFNLGTLYKKEGKIEKTIEYWKKVYQLCPNTSLGEKAKFLIDIYTE